MPDLPQRSGTQTKGDYMNTVTGPCEGTYVNDDPERRDTDALLLKCGRPGTLHKQWLLPWGVILCDYCMAQKEIQALKQEQERRRQGL
jgi:hypothetical protein